MEATVWDLRLVFGTYKPNTALDEESRIDFHTAINIPWAQIKILTYFLQMNVWFHEQEQGKIVIPERLLPSLFQSPELAQTPEGKEFIERAAKLHAETFK